MNSVIEHTDNTDLHIFRSPYSYYKMDSFHSHDMHELYYLERGNTKYFIGSDIYALNPGDLIFVPAGEYHQTNYSECTKRERLILSFENALVGSRYLKYISELIADKHVHIPNEHSAKIKSIIYKIEQENINKQRDYKVLQKIYLRELLILISRYRVTRENNKLTENDKLVQQVTKYISTNYGENLSLETLSKRYSISQGHLSKLFKKTTKNKKIYYHKER